MDLNYNNIYKKNLQRNIAKIKIEVEELKANKNSLIPRLIL